MRKLTGLFAALLFAVAVSPAVASTSDSASNDYTATVNSDVSLTYDGSISLSLPTPDSGATNSATSTSSGANAEDVTLQISPTNGAEAVVEANPYFNVSSNQSFGISIDPSVDNSTAGSSAINFDNSSGADAGVPISELSVRLDGSTVSSNSYVSLPADNANHPKTVVSGVSGGEYTDIPARYKLNTPDDLAPSDYNVTLTWTAEQGL